MFMGFWKYWLVGHIAKPIALILFIAFICSKIEHCNDTPESVVADCAKRCPIKQWKKPGDPTGMEFSCIMDSTCPGNGVERYRDYGNGQYGHKKICAAVSRILTYEQQQATGWKPNQGDMEFRYGNRPGYSFEDKGFYWNSEDGCFDLNIKKAEEWKQAHSKHKKYAHR